MSASRLKRSSVKGKAVARCRNLAQQSALRSASTENEEREFDSIVEDVNIQGIEALPNSIHMRGRNALKCDSEHVGRTRVLTSEICGRRGRVAEVSETDGRTDSPRAVEGEEGDK